MERLWSPWRLAYVTGSKASGCVFCEAVELASDPAREALVSSAASCPTSSSTCIL